MEKVLCVDDIATIRRILVKSMLQLGCKEVFEAENGQDALDFLAVNDVDLIILDINMPVMNGLEFLEKRMEDEKIIQVPVIVLTTESDHPELVDEAMKLGANAHCSKPFELKEMKQIINTIF